MFLPNFEDLEVFGPNSSVPCFNMNLQSLMLFP